MTGTVRAAFLEEIITRAGQQPKCAAAMRRLTMDTEANSGNLWWKHRHGIEVDWGHKKTAVFATSVHRQFMHYLYAGGCKSHLPHTYKGPKLGPKEQVH